MSDGEPVPAYREQPKTRELVYRRREITDNSPAERLSLFPLGTEKNWIAPRHQRLVEFVVEHHFPVDDYTIDGKAVRIVDAFPDGQRIPPDKIKTYLEEQKFMNDTVASSYCVQAAEDAMRRSATAGRLYSPEGCNDKLVRFSNHAVNYDPLPDGSVVAIDFTAKYNVDAVSNNFDTLGLRARNKTELIELLGKLYGGKWEDRPLGTFAGEKMTV